MGMKYCHTAEKCPRTEAPRPDKMTDPDEVKVRVR